MRFRLLSPLAASVALLLLVGPAAAVAPATPATGHWGSVGPMAYPVFRGSDSIVGSKVGPDGKLYVFGSFADAAGDPTADNLISYDPATKLWSGVGSNGAGDGAFNSAVWSVAWLNGVLYVGGTFTGAGGVAGADYVAGWNGSTWSWRGGPGAVNGAVVALAVQNGYLLAGGAFTNAGSDPTADYVASFDGYAWHGINSTGALAGALNGPVWAIQPLADGRVYVAGQFVNVGPSGKCDLVCWWDPGSDSWNNLGGSGGPDNALSGIVYDMVVSGSRVYVGGLFTNAGGNAKADIVAMWNGTAWTNLGSNVAGTDGALTGGVLGIRLYGSNVIVSGQFDNAGGVSAADKVAVWNGSKWMSLGSSLVNDNAFRTDLVGRVLYLGGQFSSVAGLPNTDGLAAYGLPGVASAPRSLTATAGTKRVTLKWAAPATTNGSGAVRDYVVQYRKTGTTTWKTFADGVRATTGATVTGLVPGTTYQFRVLAKTDWGTGSASATVSKRAN